MIVSHSFGCRYPSICAYNLQSAGIVAGDEGHHREDDHEQGSGIDHGCGRGAESASSLPGRGSPRRIHPARRSWRLDDLEAGGFPARRRHSVPSAAGWARWNCSPAYRVLFAPGRAFDRPARASNSHETSCWQAVQVGKSSPSRRAMTWAHGQSLSYAPGTRQKLPLQNLGTFEPIICKMGVYGPLSRRDAAVCPFAAAPKTRSVTTHRKLQIAFLDTDLIRQLSAILTTSKLYLPMNFKFSSPSGGLAIEHANHDLISSRTSILNAWPAE